MHRRKKEKLTKLRSENLGLLQDLGANGMIMLKWILEI